MTGSTGVLGRELVSELLKTTEDKLFLLIRRKKTQTHWARARKQLTATNQDVFLGTRVQVIQGDISLPGLGIHSDDLETLEREVTHLFHAAALTTLNASEEDCLHINTQGTEEALKVAWHLKQKGKLERFFYFSTAYVAGSLQTYCAREDEMAREPAFANFYEASKYQAEKKVRAAMTQGLSATIFRPSIVVGDSTTGEVGEFNVIYPFIKLFAHGILKKLPTRPENSFNIVPIDFVIQASLHIAAQENSIGKAYHLVTQNPPTIGMLVSMSQMEYPGMARMEMVDPASFKKSDLDLIEKAVYEMLEPYLGYLNDHLTFDSSNTIQALEGSGIEFPNTNDAFLKILCQYAVDQGYLVVN